jgi:hypothetical protein
MLAQGRGNPIFSIINDVVRLAWEIARSRASLIAAFVLLPYAGVLIGLDVAAHYGSLTNAELPVQFYLASDRGFGEFLEYSMTAAVAAMTLLLWTYSRAPVYLANAILFAWLTLDNWTEVHEGFGEAFGPALEWVSVFPVEASHLAEAVLMIAIGGLWLVAMAMTMRSASPRALSFSLILAACVAGAAFFGVIVDFLVVWGEQDAAFHALLVFIEDAGEFAMLILAFLVTVGFFDRDYVQKRREAEALPQGEGLDYQRIRGGAA